MSKIKPMSLLKQALLNQIDYSAWATRQLLDACADITVAEFEAHTGAAHASIGGTLRHIFVAEWIWLNRLASKSVPPLTAIAGDPSSSSEPGRRALLQQSPALWNGWREWVESLSEAGFDEPVSIPRDQYPPELHLSKSAGEPSPIKDGFQVPRWKMVQHVMNHSTLHRGQVMSMLRSLGKQPPGTDLFNYYLATAK